MAEKRLGQIDLSTGEFLDGFVAYMVPRRQNGFGDRWFAMAQVALDALMKITRVEDFRVLMALLKRLDYENMIVANQAEIARELNLDPAQVNRAIKRLIRLDALLEGPKMGINRSYRLNPEFGWKGSAKNHVVALDKYREERLRTSGITEVLSGGKLSEGEDSE